MFFPFGNDSLKRLDSLSVWSPSKWCNNCILATTMGWPENHKNLGSTPIKSGGNYSIPMLVWATQRSLLEVSFD